MPTLVLLSLSTLAPLAVSADAPVFSWQKSATSLALRNGEKVVWQLVFDAKQPKTYFHPLATVDGEVLTASRPADHPWHHGLWWSWKFINGLNYWEEDAKTQQSEGINELTDATVIPAADFSAHAELRLSYHPPGKPAVLTEVRQLSISRPDADGQYWIDWTSVFTVGAEPVKLERTPPLGKPGGVGYGGYAGLSLRFPPKIKGWSFRTSEKASAAASGHGRPARWADFSSATAGIAIFDHPNNPRHPAAWYLSDDLPYFGPAWLFNDPMELAPKQTLKLRYRVLVHSKASTAENLDTHWQRFNTPPP